MDVNELVKFLGDCCYGLLALNFLWGLYCIILSWRRVKALSFRTAQAQGEFVSRVRALLQTKDYKGVEEMCEFDSRGLARMTMLMLATRKEGYQQIRQVVAEVLQRDVVAELERPLSWIATVIKNGPLLGLFGTVLGMMAAFGRIGTGEKVQPSQIAAEISIALICTAMGLATAIPFGYVLATLTFRLRSLQESLEAGLARILDLFRVEAA